VNTQSKTPKLLRCRTTYGRTPGQCTSREAGTPPDPAPRRGVQDLAANVHDDGHQLAQDLDVAMLVHGYLDDALMAGFLDDLDQQTHGRTHVSDDRVIDRAGKLVVAARQGHSAWKKQGRWRFGVSLCRRGVSLWRPRLS
jgi:hypothetical protein